MPSVMLTPDTVTGTDSINICGTSMFEKKKEFNLVWSRYFKEMLKLQEQPTLHGKFAKGLVMYLNQNKSKFKHVEPLEQVISDFWLRIAKFGHTFRGDCDPSSFAFTVAGNARKNIIQTESRHRRRVSNVYLEEHYEPDPAATLEYEELFGEALTLLPKDMKDTLDLRLSDDSMQYKDVAEVQKIPIGTVRSRLSRATSILKSALGNQDRRHVEQCVHKYVMQL